MKINVTFELNKLQLQSMQEAAKLEPGWHSCDLIIRYNGKDEIFEADFMRSFFEAIRNLPLEKANANNTYPA